jgi:hypothetical protein
MADPTVRLIDIAYQVCTAVTASTTVSVQISVDALRDYYGRSLKTSTLSQLIVLMRLQLDGSKYSLSLRTTGKTSTDFLVFIPRKEHNLIRSVERLTYFLQVSTPPGQIGYGTGVEQTQPTLLCRKSQCLMLPMLVLSGNAPIVIQALPGNIASGIEYQYTTQAWHSLPQLQEILDTVITNSCLPTHTPGYEAINPAEISRLLYQVDDITNTLTLVVYTFFQAVFYATKETVIFSEVSAV